MTTEGRNRPHRLRNGASRQRRIHFTLETEKLIEETGAEYRSITGSQPSYSLALELLIQRLLGRCDGLEPLLRPKEAANHDE